MLKVILIIALTFFSCIGVCDILHTLWQMLLTPKNKPLSLHITFLDGSNDDAVLTWLSDHIKWYGKRLAERYIVVTSCDDNYVENEFYKDIPISFIKNKDFTDFGEFYEQYRIKRNG